MGWFWNDESTPVASASKSQAASTTPPTSPTQSTPPEPPASQPQAKAPPPPEDEFAALWRELEAKPPVEATKSAEQTSQPIQKQISPITQRKQTPSTTTQPPTTSSSPPPTTLPFTEAILPTTMSCRQAFDNAFYCQSFGGQFNNLYRYGEIRSCSELWWDFWFCMKARSLSGKGKEDMIREHNRQKMKKYEVGPSSEDVWKSRERFLEEGEAFGVEFEEVIRGETNEEWNERERKRREGRLGTLGS